MWVTTDSEIATLQSFSQLYCYFRRHKEVDRNGMSQNFANISKQDCHFAQVMRISGIYKKSPNQNNISGTGPQSRPCPWRRCC